MLNVHKYLFLFFEKVRHQIHQQPTFSPFETLHLPMYHHVLHPYQSNEKVVLKPRNQLNYSFCFKRKTETAPTMSVSFQDATDPPDRFRTHFGPGACVQPATPPQLIPRRPRKRPEISWSLSNRFRDAYRPCCRCAIFYSEPSIFSSSTRKQSRTKLFLQSGNVAYQSDIWTLVWKQAVLPRVQFLQQYSS